MHHVYKIMLSLIFVVGISEISYSQNQSHLLDLRTCGKSCSSSNYTILAVYLSDINGNPITNSLLTCTPGVEQITYLSFRYQTSSNSEVRNARIFADLKVGENSQFLNYFFGAIAPATSLPKILTLTNYPLTWTCGVEVSLNNPLLSWTTSGSADLSQNYACNSYPSAQCQLQSNIIVDAPLAVQFEYSFECPIDGKTPVTFTSTTNGGRAPYEYSWTFTDASIASSNNADQILDYYGRGTARLSVRDANGTVNIFQADLNIPIDFEYNPIITDQTDEEVPNGSILLEVDEEENLSFSWTGPNGFVSDGNNISGLSQGTYQVTIVDGYGCLKILDFEIEYIIILPLQSDDLIATINEDSREVKLSWSGTANNRPIHFEIERAIQDISNFKSVGKVPTTSGSNTYYTFTDSNLPNSRNRIYYRIKLVPEFGKPTYSSTLMVETAAGITEKMWSAFPNPFDDQLILTRRNIPPTSRGLICVKIFSLTSHYTRLFWSKEYQIDLSSIVRFAPKGILILEIEYGEKVEVLKIFKRY